MKIYLSSTYEDLKEYRSAVYDALCKAGHEVIAMEKYVASDARPVDKCLADVEKADIYVGLFAFRYGYVPPREQSNPKGQSITELEYRAAEANEHTQCLVYVKDESTPPPLKYCDFYTRDNEAGEKIKRLRDELRTEKMAPTFTTPYRLASEVQAAVSNIEKTINPAQTVEETDKAQLVWEIDKQGSPYPGLDHLTRKFAAVFCGREAEVREVLDRFASPKGHFMIISGDSGSGKSSLVDAGVLPRLEESGLPGERSCHCVYLLPSQGSNCFDALLRALHPYAQSAGLNPFEQAVSLVAKPERLPGMLDTLVARGLKQDLLVLFLDQMEELFTTSENAQFVEAFLSGLYRASTNDKLRIIATIRSDFLQHCHRHPDLLKVLRSQGHYPLGRMESYMLRDMIVQPAQRAGLRISDSLVKSLIQDAGTEPGNLPLLAFVLSQLFDQRQGGGLSEAVYDRFGGREAGGMKGALAEYAAGVQQRLGKAVDQLPELFERLLVVNVEGIPTRQRALANTLPTHLQPVVETLVQARLLSKQGEGDGATVSVAHEKLFEVWPALTHWIGENEEALRTIAMAELDASQWRAHRYDIAYLWHPDRLQRLQAILQERPQLLKTRPQPEKANVYLQEYANPQARLVEHLDRVSLGQEQRATIGRLLAQFGDPRSGVGLLSDSVPDIEWIKIPGGWVELENTDIGQNVPDIEIARYPVTNLQFQAFVDAQDGYLNERWWQSNVIQEPELPRWNETSAPRETVSWYEAVAFCKWLSSRLGYLVRLPTEFEWQLAATLGDEDRVYPWGAKWDSSSCNSYESHLNRTSVVGLYPHGIWQNGPLDMAGNVCEWCLNKHYLPNDTQIDNSGNYRTVRGSSWGNTSFFCRASYRGKFLPDVQDDFIGFRVLRPPSNEF